MPTISELIQKHEELLAEGKGTPVHPELLPPLDAPPNTIGTGIPGPVRGSYQPNQILGTDFVKANTIGGPVRSPMFPIPPNNTNNTAAAKAALNAAAKASEAANTATAAVTAISNANVVTTAGPGGSLQSGPISIGGGAVSHLPVTPRLAPRTINQDQMSLDGIVHGRVLQTALTADSVDLSKSGVLMNGSIPPVYSGSFTYTATTTSITWTWSGMTIYKADGTIINVPNGNQTITGLTAGTTYFFFPFWNIPSSALEWVTSSTLAQPLISITGATFLQGATAGWVSTTTSLTRPTTASVECWFYSVSASQMNLMEIAQNQFGTPIGGSQDFLLAMGVSTAGVISFAPGTSAISSAAAYNDGNWHHVVGTYNGTTAFLYVDGIQVATGAVTADASFSGFWRLATEQFGTTATETSSRCAVYETIALTSAQVLNHFNTMAVSGTATYDALVATDGATYYWKLIETSGTTAADSIGTNTGTYQNTSNVTLNQSQQITTSLGSPAYAWIGILVQAVQTQTLQINAPLSGTSMSASTPATGTAGGSGGGAAGSGGGGDKKFTG